MDLVTPAMAEDSLLKGKGTIEFAWQNCQALGDLRTITAEKLVEAGRRMVIVAPHPDDETLGCGGLMQLAAAQGNAVLLIAVTDGGASHPLSTTWPLGRLVRLRPQETLLALGALHIPDIKVIRLALPDGSVAESEFELCTQLSELLTENDAVFVPWDIDGHPDHEASSRATSVAASMCGAACFEMPIWGWHWATPAGTDMPWERARKLELPPRIFRRKQDAIQCYRSQVEADESSGGQPVLSTTTLARLLRPYEVYFL